MKKTLLSLFLVATVLMTIAFQTKPTTADKKYSVTYTLPEWQKQFDVIEYAKVALKSSNVPANVVLPLVDSLSSIQVGLATQLTPQVKADAAKPDKPVVKLVSDSTGKK